MSPLLSCATDRERQALCPTVKAPDFGKQNKESKGILQVELFILFHVKRKIKNYRNEEADFKFCTAALFPWGSLKVVLSSTLSFSNDVGRAQAPSLACSSFFPLSFNTKGPLLLPTDRGREEVEMDREQQRQTSNETITGEEEKKE